jgi:hypothetical protein
MKIPNFQIRLRIDGTYHRLDEVSFLLQRQAFPGGHEYSLRISNIETAQCLPSIPRGEHTNPNGDVLSDVAFMIGNLLDWTVAYQRLNGDKKFFLNTIELLVVDDKELYLEGTCSRTVP